jgi:hypothetical protein
LKQTGVADIYNLITILSSHDQGSWKIDSSNVIPENWVKRGFSMESWIRRKGMTNLFFNYHISKFHVKNTIQIGGKSWKIWWFDPRMFKHYCYMSFILYWFLIY